MNFRDAAYLDVNCWLAQNAVCPHCGVNFQLCPPQINIIPHWRGECVSPDVKELERMLKL